MEAPSEKNETLARFNDAETKGMQTKKERNRCTVDFSRKTLLGEERGRHGDDDDRQSGGAAF